MHAASANPNVQAIQDLVNEHWEQLGPEYIHTVCRSFRRRVEAVEAVEAGHIQLGKILH